MGIADIRDAFNGAAPGFSCRQAFMDIVRDDGEWQVLTFFGNGPDGNTFEVKSARLGPGKDLQIAARETAVLLKGATP
jgi:hypothetical protein